MNNLLRIVLVLAVLLALAACQANGKRFPNFEFTGKILPPDPPVIRR